VSIYQWNWKVDMKNKIKKLLDKVYKGYYSTKNRADLIMSLEELLYECDNIKSNLLKCEMCDYRWIPRVKNPVCCPKCKNHIKNTTK